MTDQEYQDFLTALARKHLARTPDKFYGDGGRDSLEKYLARLSSVGQLAKIALELSENSGLAGHLAMELRNLEFRRIADAMDRAGVLEALDEYPEVTFWHLVRSAIPNEDVDFMRRAGVDDPEVEITLAIHYARNRVAQPDAVPSRIVREAGEALVHAAERVEREDFHHAADRVVPREGRDRRDDPGPEKKKKRLFNGIGKILAGGATAVGNLLLASGTILAPNPATAYGVIASSALAIGSMGQGIGDLRGE